MAQFRILAVKFGTTVIPGVGTLNVNEDGAVTKPQTDGSIEPLAAFKLAVQDGVTFATHQVADMMALLVATGAVVGSKLSTFSGGVVVYLAEADTLGVASGSTHISVTMTAGVIVPTTLSATQGELASLEVQIIPVNSAGTTPITVATNAAYPTIPEITESFTLGRVNLNGAEFTDVTATSVSFNMTANRQFSDGAAHAKAVFVESYTPEVSITTRNADVLDSYKAGAVALSSGGLDVFLTNVPADGLPDAAATTSHVKLTIASGLVTRTASGGSNVADTTIMVHGRKPGSGSIVAWATGEAQD